MYNKHFSLFKIFNNFFSEIFKPKIKIAIISYYYGSSLSGVGIHVQNLAKYLTEIGCEVHIFCATEEEINYKHEGVIIHGIENIAMPIKSKISKKRLEYDLFESEVIKAIIRENSRSSFDIIHSQGALTKAAFLCKKKSENFWVHTFHAIESVRVKKLSKEEKEFSDLVTWIESTVNYCDGAIYVSNSLKKQSKNKYKIKNKLVIPNGVDLKIFKKSESKNKNVLFVGRFSKEKGIHLMPEFIEEVMKIENSSFTLIAPYKSLEGELLSIYKKITKLEKKYKSRVQLITKIQDKEKIAEYYTKCQVYIQPSSYESFGLCIIEAMASAKPVVAFKVGGIPEVILDCGILVKTKENFINEVIELLNNEKKAIKLGLKARKRAEEFDWNQIALKTLKYYKQIKNE